MVFCNLRSLSLVDNVKLTPSNMLLPTQPSNGASRTSTKLNIIYQMKSKYKEKVIFSFENLSLK